VRAKLLDRPFYLIRYWLLYKKKKLYRASRHRSSARVNTSCAYMYYNNIILHIWSLYDNNLDGKFCLGPYIQGAPRGFIPIAISPEIMEIL